MLFFAIKLLKFGVSEAKKHQAKKNQEQQQASADPYQNPYPDPNGHRYRSGPRPNINRQPGYFRDPYPDDYSSAAMLTEAFLHFVQLVMALVVAGLYGQDVNTARQQRAYADPKWVYALVTSGLAALTALVLLVLLVALKNNPLPCRPRAHLPLFAYECVLCVLWLTLFGIFGRMYIREDPEGDDGIVRMKHAVWVDLSNLGLWVVSATWSGLRWRKSTKGGAGGDAEKAEL